mmetsp:Transcript_33177/g.59378  ORF Transcript_33177/g.59378 Transcript_33177/m.59378 type:complete len:248 (-) Transcript_33177:1710-2453(-)
MAISSSWRRLSFSAASIFILSSSRHRSRSKMAGMTRCTSSSTFGSACNSSAVELSNIRANLEFITQCPAAFWAKTRSSTADCRQIWCTIPRTTFRMKAIVVIGAGAGFWYRVSAGGWGRTVGQGASIGVGWGRSTWVKSRSGRGRVYAYSCAMCFFAMWSWVQTRAASASPPARATLMVMDVRGDMTVKADDSRRTSATWASERADSVLYSVSSRMRAVATAVCQTEAPSPSWLLLTFMPVWRSPMW